MSLWFDQTDPITTCYVIFSHDLIYRVVIETYREHQIRVTLVKTCADRTSKPNSMISTVDIQMIFSIKMVFL